MKTPPSDSLRLAALWLRSNDGDESAQLRPVAAWLEAKAMDADLRTLARESGVPVKLARTSRRVLAALNP